jgi:U4/U6.U5 tri-snRNP-associated protein 2
MQGLGGSSKQGSSIVHKCFQGLVEVRTTIESKPVAPEEEHGHEEQKIEERPPPTAAPVTKTAVTPFLYVVNLHRAGIRWISVAEKEAVLRETRMLALDLPSTPLFKDSQGGNIIPQVRTMSVETPHAYPTH